MSEDHERPLSSKPSLLAIEAIDIEHDPEPPADQPATDDQVDGEAPKGLPAATDGEAPADQPHATDGTAPKSTSHTALKGHARSRMRTTRPESLSRFYDVERYRRVEKLRKRRHVVRIAVLVFALLVVGVIAAAGVYVSNINTRLTADVTDELRDQLVHTEPGDPFYLLLLGVDKDQSRVEDSENYGADEHAYRSDSIMLCRIDPKRVKVTMVSIHRDTLVDMEIYGQQKINAAYAFGGPAYATRVISEFAGVPISHYAEVDLDRFIAIVDQVGGVTVTLPVPVYDPEYTGLDLPAGTQKLDGTQAALLCRCRHGYDEYGDGDRFRAANQRMVFSEVIKKVLKSDPATIAATVTTMADSVTTDMDVTSILELASQMQSLNVETDIMTGMEPTDGALIGGTWYEICLVDEWQKMMTRVHKGLPPYDESQGEYDSTAGIAGGVGEEGARAEEAAVAADAKEAEELEGLSDAEDDDSESESVDKSDGYDSTAGIAGGVGEEGARAEEAAVAADAKEAEELEGLSDAEDDDSESESESVDKSDGYDY